MDALTVESLSPREKAAVLLISLGKDSSAQIYKYLTGDEIEQLTLTITSIRRVESHVKEAVIEEFHEICMAQRYISEGGIEYARQSPANPRFGAGRRQSFRIDTEAFELFTSTPLRLRPQGGSRAGHQLPAKRASPDDRADFILSGRDAGRGDSGLASAGKTGARIASMGVTSPDFVKEAERILERKLSTMGAAEHTIVGGIDSIVAILNAVDRSTEKHILESLDEDNGELADEIRSRMFVFEDIVKLSNQAVQRVLKEVENSELAIALKGATKEVSTLIFNNISKRLQDMIKEDMEFMGPVRVRDVEENQQKIVNIIRRLEDAGEIIISRGAEDEVIV